MYEAMCRLNKKCVSVVQIEHLSKDQELAYLIADNKTTDLSTFDYEMLATHMRHLESSNVSLDATGFVEHEIEPLLKSEFQPEKVGVFEMTESKDKIFSLNFTESQFTRVDEAIKELQTYEGFDNLTPVEAIVAICMEYVE